MSHQKDKHYWTQLRSALAAGQWSVQYPARAPNGIALSWSELFRKFNKHCRGFNDVSEIASQTQALALLLAANSKDEDQDDAVEGVQYPLNLGAECILPEERVEEASAGYEVLKRLESSNFDTLNFALAYYAYALGNPVECLVHLEKVPNIMHLQNHIPAQNSSRSSATGLLVPGSEAASSFSSAGGSFASLADSSAPEIRDGRGWAMTETLRSICLQGMCHEKISPSDPRKALEYYGAALPLLMIAMSEITPPSVPTTSGKIDLTFFTQYRELWRWVERLIWRATVLSSRIGNIHEDANGNNPMSIWTWLGQYSVCSVYWPANFRTVHRSTISSLYLRALIMRHGHKPNKSLPLPDSRKSPPWLPSARTVVNDYRAILSVSTSFPRAGQHNIQVEDFIDLCVGVWETSGAVGDHAGWVLDVLWWATRLTFNSYRILRHMTRLLYASGDTPLAKRTLRLYIQVVGKAWQASGETLTDDTDENDSWVETLISGSRMLCKSASVTPGLEGIKDAREAGVCIEKARTRLDKNNTHLVARVNLAEGIWHSAMALAEQDPHTRPKHFSDAHSLFLQSIETHPTPSAYFHLALSFARPGPYQDLTSAIENAGSAVEGDATEIRYWHLLGLLLAAKEQWKAANEILERGAELSEIDQDGGDDNNGSDSASTNNGGTLETDAQTLRVPPSAFTNGSSVQTNGAEKVSTNSDKDPYPSTDAPNGVSNYDRSESITPTPESKPPLHLLEKDMAEIPSPSQLLNPVADHLEPSQQEIFEYALQLRMSQVTLTETMEGPEGSELGWLDIFSWIAEKKGAASEVTPRPSIDGGRPSTGKPPSFVLSPPSVHQIHNTPVAIPAAALSEKMPRNDLQPIPIPITISPATPDDEVPPRRSSSEKNEKKTPGGLRVKRSSSIDRDTSKSKKVQQMLKNRVHKGQARITTISRKIGSGVVRNGSLKRSNSAPDFHFVLRQTSYQASSIHSRRRLSSIIHHHDDRTPTDSPPPPPPPIPPPQETKRNGRIARSNHLLANLWLMSAATFRRLGKIEQARGAIQEAEVRDEANPAVWVQLGLYYVALGHETHATDAFQKALFISPDDIAATVHLARLHLSINEYGKTSNADGLCSTSVDLAAGMLSHLTRGNGWDVPEAWYFLAKAYGMQGRKEMERECLSFALALSETRGIRDIGSAVGWCI
ncbi:hypothetical protein BDZ94DRAFT_1155674 [Collybia nuda]|uniref:TPR-like protein n=1 Tax=Collybia nuda TaxID=64659 RepID=A0A9P5YE22_9AGAR|nr:hypothetical protein BDZ94DRAFT_1155674 [Collybia nuda]